MKRPRANLFADGWQIVLNNWRCLFWLYALNLTFGLLSGIPLSASLAPYLDHNLAARQIAGNLDAASLGELALHLSRNHLLAGAGHSALGLALVEFLATILLAGGTLRIYLAGEPPRLPVLLARGSEYFWRMVRVSLLFALTAGLVLAVLLAAREALLTRLQAVYVERTMFLYTATTGAFVLLVALLLRLWFDLIEIYTVRNGAVGERRIRQAIRPAIRLLLRNFWRTSGSFLLIALLGTGALAACLLLWKDLAPPDQVWLAALIAQLGLLLSLAARYWQRAVQVALVLAAEPPVAIPVPAVAEPARPATPVASLPAAGAEPTLRDLVLKLQTEPLAKPETIAPPNRALFPETLWSALNGETRPPQDALLEEHEKKIPLPASPDGTDLVQDDVEPEDSVPHGPAPGTDPSKQ